MTSPATLVNKVWNNAHGCAETVPSAHQRRLTACAVRSEAPA